MSFWTDLPVNSKFKCELLFTKIRYSQKSHICLDLYSALTCELTFSLIHWLIKPKTCKEKRLQRKGYCTVFDLLLPIIYWYLFAFRSVDYDDNRPGDHGEPGEPEDAQKDFAGRIPTRRIRKFYGETYFIRENKIVITGNIIPSWRPNKGTSSKWRLAGARNSFFLQTRICLFWNTKNWEQSLYSLIFAPAYR